MLRPVLLLVLAAALIAGEAAPALALSALPPGRLQAQVAALPAASRTRALQRLAKHGLRDADSMHVDRAGGLFYVCAAAPPAVPAPAVLPAAVPLAAPVPIASPPVRHSRAGSAQVLYLDFNGHVLTGTAWNGAVSSYTAKAFDADGDPLTFSDAEQAAIIRIWERVAEDFAPFDLDVTTEAPASFTTTTGRVLVTSKTDAGGQAMPSSGAGGVAYVDIFGDADCAYYSPALVYFDNLSGREDYIAEVCSHEAGHNLGLSHDGSAAGAYYAGHAGGGVPSWAPIMGAGYGREVTQWSRGEYTGANQTQDDLAIIAAHVPYRPDDHGGTPGAATLLLFGSSATAAVSAGQGGIIGSAADVDVFRLILAPGPLSITVDPYRCAADTPGGDLDVRLELRDAGGVLVAADDPAATTSATIAAAIAVAGDYYLSVRSASAGDPLALTPTGYTTYASLGQFSISGSAVVGAQPTISAATVAPAPVTGTTAACSATATDDGGEPALVYSWSTLSKPAGAADPAFLPNGSNAAKAAAATFDRAGSYSLRLSVTDGTGLVAAQTVAVDVQQTAAVLGAVGLGGSSTVGVLTTRTFAAAGTDQFGQPLAGGVAWSVSGGGSINAATGVFTAAGAVGGPYVATATAGALSSTAAFTITDAAPVITSGPAINPSPVTGTTAALSASADDDGTAAALVFAWTTLAKPATAPAPSFSPNGSTAANACTVTFSRAGAYTLGLSVSDQSGHAATAALAVTVQQTLTAWTVTPNPASTPIGGMVAFAATRSDQFGQPCGAGVPTAWLATGGGISATGAYTAGAVAGSYTVTATGAGVQGTAAVTVAAPVPAAASSSSGGGGSGCGLGGGIAALLAIGGILGLAHFRERRPPKP